MEQCKMNAMTVHIYEHIFGKKFALIYLHFLNAKLSIWLKKQTCVYELPGFKSSYRSSAHVQILTNGIEGM